jgi:hypothetical protein
MVPRERLGLLSKSGVIVVLELRKDLVVGCGGDDATDEEDDWGLVCSGGMTTVPILLRKPAAFNAFTNLCIAHPPPFSPFGPNLGHCDGGTLYACNVETTVAGKSDDRGALDNEIEDVSRGGEALGEAFGAGAGAGAVVGGDAGRLAAGVSNLDLGLLNISIARWAAALNGGLYFLQNLMKSSSPICPGL